MLFNSNVSQKNPRRDGSIERVDMPRHRDLYDEVASLKDKARYAKPFAANDKANGAFVIHLIVSPICASIRGNDPVSRVFEF